jgi:hypothetical protein
MTAGKLTPQDLQNLRDFATQWGKIIARRAFGEAGPPLDADLFTLEQAAQAAAQGLLQGTLATLLEQQAQALPDPQPCPDCQQLCPVQHEPRTLDCLGGSVTYDEPVCHCPACRRDFFPSAAHLASERPPLQP